MLTIYTSLLMMITSPLILYDFNTNSNVSYWNVIDDDVMGGRSDGYFRLNESGNGEFTGNISLENNGGFSMVRLRFDRVDVRNYDTFLVRLKGDGKRYQLRVKANGWNYHSYVKYFETTGDWQTVEIPMESMYPSLMGRKLLLPNYGGKTLAEIGFLIGNKKAENFKLEIDKIELK